MVDIIGIHPKMLIDFLPEDGWGVGKVKICQKFWESPP